MVLQSDDCKDFEYVECPVCGHPIKVGTACPGGCEVKACLLTIDELRALLQSSDEYNIVLKNYSSGKVLALVYRKGIKPPLKNRVLSIRTVHAPRETVYKALLQFLADFIYRRECNVVEETMQKYSADSDTKKTYTFRVTPKLMYTVKLARAYYDVPVSKIVGAYILKLKKGGDEYGEE